MKHLGHIRLGAGAQIINFLPELRADDPAVGALFEGRGWWNTTTKTLKFYNGTEVVTLATGGSLDDYLRTDGSVALTADLVLSSADQSASADNVAVSKGYVASLLAAKQATITGAASTIATADLSGDKVLVSDAAGKVVVATVTSAELAYLSGVTANVQTQLDGKQDELGYTPYNKAGDTLGGVMNAGGYEITSVGAPQGPNSAARLIDVENAVAGLNWQQDIKGVQVDATMDPGAAPVEGDRYVLTNVAALHANFGVIADVANNDIVEYIGGAFVVSFDVSADPKAEGAIAWDSTAKTYQRYVTGSWGSFGGLGDLGAGVGLSKDGSVLNVNLGAGIVELPTDGIGIDLSTNSGLKLIDVNGDESTDAEAKLSIKLDGASLAVGAKGVKVAPEGVTAAEIAAASLGNGLAGGAGVALNVKAKADGGIVVDADGVSVDNAKLGETFLAKAGDTAADLKVTAAPVAATDVARLQEVNDAKQVAADATAALEARFEGSQYVYDGLASVQATHTIVHNLNDSFPLVEVMDATGETVLPDSIVRTNANTVTVTVVPAAGIRVVVQGVKS